MAKGHEPFALHSVYRLSKVKTMAAGATPKVTTSASESSSFPSAPETPKRRAMNPSKKSKTAPRTMKSSAMVSAPLMAKWMAMQPQMRLQLVIELGICFFTMKRIGKRKWSRLCGAQHLMRRSQRAYSEFDEWRGGRWKQRETGVSVSFTVCVAVGQLRKLFFLVPISDSYRNVRTG